MVRQEGTRLAQLDPEPCGEAVLRHSVVDPEHQGLAPAAKRTVRVLCRSSGYQASELPERDVRVG
jgi:hypothetical protein